MDNCAPGKSTFTLLFLLLSAANFAVADHVVPAKRVTSFVNVRKSPQAGAEKIGTLKVGERAKVLETLREWRKLRLANGVEGYISIAWTRITPGNDFEHGEEAFDQGDYQKAHSIWEPLAQAGDPHAQFWLGNLYFRGIGLKKDRKTAAEWYRKSALQGHALAQFNLGNAYKHGRGVPKDEALASQWWQKAAEQGLASAQYNLGLHYYYGRGVKEDRETATQWFARAAQAGHLKAARLFEPQPATATRKAPSGEHVINPAERGLGTPSEIEKWIAKQLPDEFTIQLLVTRDTQALKAFMDQSRFADPVAWFRFSKSGETWFALVHGAYASREQARSAIKNLPDNVRKSEVWIRPFADIHEILRKH